MTEFRVPVRNVVHSQHWPPLTRRKWKNVTQYSDSLLLKIFTSGTSYSEIYSLSDINFPYTGLYPEQGPRGKRPELESQLTSKAASSKKTTIRGFLPPVRAQTSLTRVPSDSGHFPRTWKPVSLHNQHHITLADDVCAQHSANRRLPVGYRITFK